MFYKVIFQYDSESYRIVSVFIKVSKKYEVFLNMLNNEKYVYKLSVKILNEVSEKNFSR